MDVQKYFSSFHIIYCIFTQRMTKACVCLSLVLSLSYLVYKNRFCSSMTLLYVHGNMFVCFLM
jgi:hypothetical protein